MALYASLAARSSWGQGASPRRAGSLGPSPAAHPGPRRPRSAAAPERLRNGLGRPCPAGGAQAQVARKTEEEALPYAAPELAGVGRGSCDPSPAQQRLRWPRPLFLLQQRRLVKGKDVGGGGSSSRRVSRDLGGTLARSGTLAPPRSPAREMREVGGGVPREAAGGGEKGSGFNWGRRVPRFFFESQIPRTPHLSALAE